jgi:hypothetical protein
LGRACTQLTRRLFGADLNSMRFTSIVGLICSLYAMLLLLAQVSTHEPLSEMTATPGIGLWNALPTINVAYSLHYNGIVAVLVLVLVLMMNTLVT